MLMTLTAHAQRPKSKNAFPQQEQIQFTGRRNLPGTISCPNKSGESIILLTYHVNGFHWVAVSRKEHNGVVSFYYADDLNCPCTEAKIK
jgi:hypothetical protein